MERIGADGYGQYRREVKRDRRSERKRASRGIFDSLLASKETDGELHTSALEVDGGADPSTLVQNVLYAGERLKEHIDPRTLEEYKAAVHRFLAAVVHRGVDVEERVSGSNIFKRKRFALVTVIDQKLSSLAAEVLSGQRRQLEILSRIEEINGLIVDLEH